VIAEVIATVLAVATSQMATESQIRVCGEVTARRMFPPACHTVLHVKASDQEYDVFIPVAVAKDLSIPPERLRGAQVCFSGLAGSPTVSPRMQVQSTAGVEIVTLPAGLSSPSPAVVPCGAGVVLPRVITDAKPEYTRNAMRARVQGPVEVEAIVGTHGTISEPRIVRSLHPELDKQALEAVKLWKFTPGANNGKPAPILVEIELNFKLK
jgi:TonB family protein